jgi:hypothetical protein
LSGIRRLKEAVIALDIKDYTPDPAFDHGLHGFKTDQKECRFDLICDIRVISGQFS